MFPRDRTPLPVDFGGDAVGMKDTFVQFPSQSRTHQTAKSGFELAGWNIVPQQP